jgi:hypothetical protein
MSRGGKHGDTSALGKMMATVQGWVDNSLTGAQIQSEDEGGQEEDEDDEEESQVGSSGAGAAAAQGPVHKQRAGGVAMQAASAQEDADSAPSSSFLSERRPLFSVHSFMFIHTHTQYSFIRSHSFTETS